jgi:pimeloyl-ACP methyl ester carboxylesterase
MRIQLVLLLGLYVFAPGVARSEPPKHKTSIVLVHGAWTDGSSWDKVVPLLEAKGFDVIAVHLPLTTTSDDIATTERAIERATGDVVLVGHAYGGFVITAAGNAPKVKALVYVDAYALDDGETINGVLGAKRPAWTQALQLDAGGFAWLSADLIANDFAPDLTLAQQHVLAAKQAPVSLRLFDDPMRGAAWKLKASWYVQGNDDRIIPPAVQARMARRIKAKLIEVDAGHVSMLSKPRAIAEVIIEAAATEVQTASQ